MTIYLKIAHFYCLFLLSSYLCSPAFKFPTGLGTVGILQQYLVILSLPGSILYYSHYTKRLYKQVSVNTKSNGNKKNCQNSIYPESMKIAIVIL